MSCNITLLKNRVFLCHVRMHVSVCSYCIGFYKYRPDVPRSSPGNSELVKFWVGQVSEGLQQDFARFFFITLRQKCFPFTVLTRQFDVFEIPFLIMMMNITIHWWPWKVAHLMMVMKARTYCDCQTAIRNSYTTILKSINPVMRREIIAELLNNKVTETLQV